MSANVPTCPACGGGDTGLLFDFGRVPRTGVFLAGPSGTFPLRNLAFHFCRRCACVMQQPDRAAPADYTEVSRGTARQLPAYAGEIIDWAVNAATGGRLLVEVGSNDGTFLTQLRDAGVHRLLGVEPSRALAEACHAAGHRVENIPLTGAAAVQLSATHGAAAAVVCRHTLEHVPEPAAFLAAIRHLLADGGGLFIEVPSVMPILDARLHAYELWDEHLSYFSEANLSLLLAASGFAVERIESRPHCGSDNILCWARATAPSASPRLRDAQGLVAACTTFAPRWQQVRTSLAAAAASWQRPIVAMGASHPQTNFLHFSGLAPLVSALADDDPSKAGRWVPGTPALPVIPGSALAQHAKGGTVLLTGFGYDGWMARVRGQCASQGIAVIDPLTLLREHQTSSSE